MNRSPQNFWQMCTVHVGKVLLTQSRVQGDGFPTWVGRNHAFDFTHAIRASSWSHLTGNLTSLRPKTRSSPHSRMQILLRWPLQCKHLRQIRLVTQGRQLKSSVIVRMPQCHGWLSHTPLRTTTLLINRKLLHTAKPPSALYKLSKKKRERIPRARAQTTIHARVKGYRRTRRTSRLTKL